MAISMVAASWIATGLILLYHVFPNPVFCDQTARLDHAIHNGAVNMAHQALKRVLTVADREEIQRALDRAIVKNYVERKWKQSIRDGEITETVQTTGGEEGKHVRFEKVGDLRLWRRNKAHLF